MVQGAFVGWQVIGSFVGSAKVGSFQDYAKNMGLIEGEKITPKQRQAEIEEARERVRSIREKFAGGVRKVLW